MRKASPNSRVFTNPAEAETIPERWEREGRRMSDNVEDRRGEVGKIHDLNDHKNHPTKDYQPPNQRPSARKVDPEEAIKVMNGR